MMDCFEVIWEADAHEQQAYHAHEVQRAYRGNAQQQRPHSRTCRHRADKDNDGEEQQYLYGCTLSGDDCEESVSVDDRAFQ